MVVGALQPQLPQRALEGFASSTGVARLLATRTGQHRAGVVRGVGVQSMLYSAGRHAHRLAAHRHLDGLEVPLVNRAPAYQRFNLGDDLRFESPFEAPFLAASCEAASGAASWASPHCSQARQYASTSSRNSWPASTCWRASAACSAVRYRD